MEYWNNTMYEWNGWKSIQFQNTNFIVNFYENKSNLYRVTDKLKDDR